LLPAAFLKVSLKGRETMTTTMLGKTPKITKHHFIFSLGNSYEAILVESYYPTFTWCCDIQQKDTQQDIT
jgi:hypothetical protein